MAAMNAERVVVAFILAAVEWMSLLMMVESAVLYGRRLNQLEQLERTCNQILSNLQLQLHIYIYNIHCQLSAAKSNHTTHQQSKNRSQTSNLH